MELTTEERDRFRAVVWDQPPVEQMGTLLTLNKLVEQRTAGGLHELTEYLTAALVVVLAKHAPEVLGEACAELARESDEAELERLDAMARTTAVDRLLAEFVDDEEGSDG